jgi:hypothetical protein
MAITGCKNRRTERFLAGERVKEFQAFADAAAKALTKLQAAVLLGDLRNPPSNHFKAGTIQHPDKRPAEGLLQMGATRVSPLRDGCPASFWRCL